jgi:hypothetical protein
MYPDAIEKLALPQGAPAARSPKTAGWSWLAVPSVLVLLIVWTRCDYPLDYWLHVNSGRWIVWHGQWMERDPFSFTITGQPIDNQAWLAQIAMFRIHELGGYALAQFAAGVAYAGSLFLVVWLAYRRTGDARAAGVLGCLSAALMATNLGVRPQMFSAVLFALQLYVLSRWRSMPGVTLAVGLMAALWTNLHGAYPLSIVLCASYAGRAIVDGYQYQIWQPLRRAVAALVASVAGCLVRPDPASTWGYVWGVS